MVTNVTAPHSTLKLVPIKKLVIAMDVLYVAIAPVKVLLVLPISVITLTGSPLTWPPLTYTQHLQYNPPGTQEKYNSFFVKRSYDGKR
jgi:hypothetical protein